MGRARLGALLGLLAGCHPARLPAAAPPAPGGLAGQVLPLLPSPHLRLAVEGHLDGRPVAVVLDVARALSAVSSGCWDEQRPVPPVMGSARVPDAAALPGNLRDWPLVRVVDLRVGSAALGPRGMGLTGERACAVTLGADVLAPYALTVEREVLAVATPLSRQLDAGTLALPADEAVVDMAQTLRDVYASGGLARYEISNHARPGLGSRHNALYWTGGEYLALGVGATGMLLTSAPGEPPRGSRYVNPRGSGAYLRAVEEGRSLEMAEREALGPEELFEERLSMGLRLRSGVDWEAVCRRYGQSPEPRRAEVARLVRHGLARLDGPRLVLTDAGADVHSAICARLL